MTVPAGHKRRDDLLYRNMAEVETSTFAEDPRLAAITDRVIDYMNKTDPEDWTKDQWTLFKVLWTEARTSRQQKATEAMTSMTMADLKNSLHGTPSTTPD